MIRDIYGSVSDRIKMKASSTFIQCQGFGRPGPSKMDYNERRLSMSLEFIFEIVTKFNFATACQLPNTTLLLYSDLGLNTCLHGIFLIHLMIATIPLNPEDFSSLGPTKSSDQDPMEPRARIVIRFLMD